MAAPGAKSASSTTSNLPRGDGGFQGTLGALRVRPRASLVPRTAVARVALSFVCGALGYMAVAPRLPPMAAALVGWDIAGSTLLAFSWTLIGAADVRITQERAGAEDPGRTLVYVIVLLTSAASLLAATILVRSAHVVRHTPEELVAFLCLATVALAWTITHTAFALRYAHLYYREDDEGIGGVSIPGDLPPTYFDFAYFAFTIGMCFQVSDVSVTSQQIRRTVLLQAVISFAYNSVILAFVLNLVFGLAS